MDTPIHPRLASLFSLLDLLELAAREIARDAQQKYTGRKPRSRRGTTLRPGIDTPLWNAVVPLVRARLRRKGDRALLARELSLHRARIGEYFDRPTAMPDAERTLRLLLWLNRSAPPAPPKRGRS
jgi:hypothetical protein